MGAHEHKQQDSNSAEAGAESQGAAATDAGAITARPTSEAAPDLPMIQAPNLDGGEATGAAAADDLANFTRAQSIPMPRGEQIGASGENAGFGARPPRSLRFALLAASIGIAAGGGAFLGAWAAGGFAQRPPASAARARAADSLELARAVKAELATLSALKASLDEINRSANAQFAKLAQRVDNLQRAQAEPTAKLAQLADALDRLEKQVAALSNVTGSIAADPRPKTPEASASAPVLTGWIVRDVRGGRAMIESRYGDLVVVGAGSLLPGLGRVEQVKRQDGRWIVVTASGLITSPR